MILASPAARMPTLTPVWSTAAIQGRHWRGQVSDSSDAPTAHSPPMPSAARNRKMSRVPPRLRKERQPGEGGVSQHRQAQRTRAAQPVADAPEEPAPQRPAQHEAALDDRTVAAHARVGGGGGPEQLRDERRGHQRVEVHVQPVERPAQPRGDARAPLLARELAQMRDLASDARAGLRPLTGRRCCPCFTLITCAKARALCEPKKRSKAAESSKNPVFLRRPFETLRKTFEAPSKHHAYLARATSPRPATSRRIGQMRRTIAPSPALLR